MKQTQTKGSRLIRETKQSKKTADNSNRGMTPSPIETEQTSRLLLVRQYPNPQRIKIDFDQIVRLEADGMDCIIWLSGNLRYTATKPMSTVLDRLPAEHFKRCHRSHVININYVISVQHNSIQLEHTPVSIPIGDRKIHTAFDLWDRTNSL